MNYTVDTDDDCIIIADPISRSELDTIARNNGLSKDYTVFPLMETIDASSDKFYYTIEIEKEYWVHDMSN